MSTLAVNTITDANGGNNARLNGPACPDNSMGFRNRIINGDMRIDQRNAGAAVTISTTSNVYTLDRWFASGASADGVFTVDQVTDVPTSGGFTNSTKVTVTTEDASIGADQSYLFSQFIEGNNFGDAMFGTANAKSITVSFWVRSSVTGTFGATLNNSSINRNYPFTYTISAADTWEYKTITVAGDTTGTWLTDTGRGIGIRFSFGTGSNRVATAGAWTGTSSILGATGQVQLIETLNATWYITGVQLEVGSVATPFERRPYGTELSLCQRYYYKEPSASFHSAILDGPSADYPSAFVVHPVEMRATPTTVFESLGDFYYNNAGTASFVPSGGTTAYGGGGNTRLGISRKNGISNGPGSGQAQKLGQWNVQLSFSAEL